MQVIANYGNTRFKIKLTAQYFASLDINRCRDCFVVSATIYETASTPVEIVMDCDTILDGIRNFGIILKSYESPAMYYALTESLVAQYKNADAEMMQKHLSNLTNYEISTRAADDVLRG